jgi:diacylglycerol kinase (ATP)
MRILLIHKSGAGEGGHRKKDLLRPLDEHGHDVHYVSRDEDWEDDLADGYDLVLIAGGDGSVAKVLRRMVGAASPFAIIPVGSANNIATQLRWTREIDDLAAGLDDAVRRPFSIGLARGPWGVKYFLEGVGLGPFTSTMSFIKSQKKVLAPPPTKRGAKLRRDLQFLRAFLTESRAVRLQLELDGESLEDDFLLVEVMNTGRIGPNIQLAPDADVADELLDVVLVQETERRAFMDYLERLEGGDASPPALPVRRARHIRLAAAGCRIHIDDDLWPAASEPPPSIGTPFEVEITLHEEPLTALVPHLEDPQQD